MVYKRGRGWTSGLILPALSFVNYPPSPPRDRHIYDWFYLRVRLNLRFNVFSKPTRRLRENARNNLRAEALRGHPRSCLRNVKLPARDSHILLLNRSLITQWAQLRKYHFVNFALLEQWSVVELKSLKTNNIRIDSIFLRPFNKPHSVFL